MKFGKREVQIRSFLIFFYCFAVLFATFDSIWWGVTVWLCGWGILSHLVGILAERRNRKYLSFFIIGIIVYPVSTAIIMYFVDPFLR